MARAQVRDVSAPERIQGIASPVSTYVRPADPPRSSLHELAEGLSAFDSGLSSFMAQRKAESDEADKARAITDFHRNNQESFAEAVRTGKIPPTASKSYVEWYKKQQGNLAGLKLSDKFAIDYQQWEGRNSDDPEAFGKFVSTWMTQNVGEEQDPYVLEGLAPHLDRLATSGYDTFSQDRAASLRAKSQATSGAILTDTISRTQEAGRAEGTVDYDALWTSLMAQRQEAISKGERGEDFDKLIVDSVILQAEESGSKEVLKVLDRQLPGQDLPLSSNPEFREKRLRAIDRINSKRASQATDIAQTRERLEKQRHEELLSQAVLTLSNGEDVPEETITELSRRDGEIRYKLAKYKKEYQDLETQEDPQALMEVYREIDSGAGKKFVLDMREKGVIKDPATFLKAMDRAEAVQKAIGDGGIFSSPTYKDTVKFITDQTGTDQLSLDGSKGLSDEGLEALYDYRNKLLDWDMKHPDSSLLEKEKAAREIGDFIRSRIQDATGLNANTKKEYISDADAAQRAAEPQEPAQTVQVPETSRQEDEGSYIPQAIRNIWDYFTGAEAEQPAAAPGDSTGLGDENTVPPIESLSPTTRQSLEAFAKKKGLSVNEAYGILSGRVQKLQAESGQGVEPAPEQPQAAPSRQKGPVESFVESLPNIEDVDLNPLNLIRRSTSDFRENLQSFEQGLGTQTTGRPISGETRSKLVNLLKDPPKVERLTASNVPVAPLLNLLGYTERTDKGDGYNETLGYGAYTGGDVDLVNMTLGDIDQLQTKMLRHPDNRLNSSAVGRYQIIRTTLRELKKEMGLTDDMKFTKQLQDQMAMRLLERRGLSKWQAGQMSDDQFMDNLSAEWASLPKANGKGTYAGQRVGTSSGDVRGVLDKVRGTEVTSLDPSIGMTSGSDPYANIPDVDSAGNAGQREKFREWNPDPVGNHEANLQSVNPALADVVRRAQEISGAKFVVGSGKRTPEMQKKAVEWGWSKTEESDHLDGSSVDLWPVDASGSIKFDPAMQQEVVMAMKLAAKELGVSLDIGAEWKKFKDKPHFGIKHKK